jgi:hypothetical protein
LGESWGGRGGGDDVCVRGGEEGGGDREEGGGDREEGGGIERREGG